MTLSRLISDKCGRLSSSLMTHTVFRHQPGTCVCTPSLGSLPSLCLHLSLSLSSSASSSTFCISFSSFPSFICLYLRKSVLYFLLILPSFCLIDILPPAYLSHLLLPLPLLLLPPSVFLSLFFLSFLLFIFFPLLFSPIPHPLLFL